MTTIVIKNSSTASAVPTSSDLVQGELAVNVTDKRIYTENASGTVVELGTNPSTVTTTTVNGLTVGKGAGSVATNTAVGASALAANTSGASNTAIGNSSLISNTTASYNTAVGFESARAITSGQAHTALGNRALYSTTTSDYNVGIGYFAGYNTTTGGSNTALGSLALYSNTTASNNTAVGYQAGYSGTTAPDNTYLGYQAGYSNVSGSFNTFVGKFAGYYMTGSKNTVIGRYDGTQGGLNITTASNYVVLSDGDGTPKCFWSSGGDFYNASTNGPSWTTQTSGGGSVITLGAYYSRDVASASGRYWFAGASGSNGAYVVYNAANAGVYMSYGATSWTANSDERLKDIIEPITDAANKVASMRSVIGKYKTDEEGTRRSFLIAQDVQAVLPEAISTHKNEGDDTEYLGVSYTDVIPLLVAAIKELKAEIDILKGQA